MREMKGTRVQRNAAICATHFGPPLACVEDVDLNPNLKYEDSGLRHRFSEAKEFMDV